MDTKNPPFNNQRRKGLAAVIFITLLFAGCIILSASSQGGFANLEKTILYGIAIGFSCFVIFMILYTGRINPWRKIFFIVYAIGFTVSYAWATIESHGHMWLTDKYVLNAELTMCHFVVPMLFLPMVFKGEIIFPGDFFGKGILMFLAVLIIGIIYGKAICSWGCFFGGQDELFASIPRKKSWSIKKLHPFIRYFPFALLTFIILHSFATMTPTYCAWFCPFKATTVFIEVNSFIRVIQTVIFFGLWLALVLILPLLTKKRIQCGLFCPMGAFLSCSNKINLFNLKIDKNKCPSDCDLCIQACPTFSMTRAAITKGTPSITCTRCGTCIDTCPQGAIAIVTKGVHFPVGNQSLTEGKSKTGSWKRFISDVLDPHVIFIFGIFALSSMLASYYIVALMSKLLNFFSSV